MSTKLERVREELERADLDAVLLGSQSNVAWTTVGGRSHISIGEAGGVASVLVTRAHTWVVSNNIEIARLFEEEIPREPFEAASHAWHRPAGERDAVAEPAVSAAWPSREERVGHVTVRRPAMLASATRPRTRAEPPGA